MVKGGSGNRAAVCMVALRGECRGRVSFLGNKNKALEMDVVVHRGPIGGPERGH